MKRPLPLGTNSEGSKRQSTRLVLKLDNVKKKYAEEESESSENEHESKNFNKAGVTEDKENQRLENGPTKRHLDSNLKSQEEQQTSQLEHEAESSANQIDVQSQISEDSWDDYDSDDIEESTTQGSPTQAIVQPGPEQTLVSTDVRRLLDGRYINPYRAMVYRGDYFYPINSDGLASYFRTSFNLSSIRNIALSLGLSGRKSITKAEAVTLVSNYAERLKQEYRIEQFNFMVDHINQLFPGLDRLPYLPPVVSAIPILNRSLQIASNFTRPRLPFQFQEAAGIKAITGSIFLDAADLDYYCTDFYFEIRRQLEAECDILVCLYRCDTTPLTNPSNVSRNFGSNDTILPTWNTVRDPGYNYQSKLCTTYPILSSVSVLDFALNGQELKNFYRNEPLFYNITSLCKRNEPNRLRCIKLPFGTHKVTNLVLEIIGILPRAPLSQPAVNSAPLPVPAVAPSVNQNSFGYACLQGSPELKDRNWILKMLKPAQSDDIMIADDSITIDLRCPISLGRIRCPVRFTQCKHPQCFDYDVFKQFALAGLAKSKDVKCPVCFVSVTRTAKLIECGLVREVLNGDANLTKVKLDLNTGNIIQNETENGITLASSDEDEGSDGENGLRLAIQQSSAVVIPETTVAPSSKSFTFIDLCDSDEENYSSTNANSNRDTSQVIFIS